MHGMLLLYVVTLIDLYFTLLLSQIVLYAHVYSTCSNQLQYAIQAYSSQCRLQTLVCTAVLFSGSY